MYIYLQLLVHQLQQYMIYHVRGWDGTVTRVDGKGDGIVSGRGRGDGNRSGEAAAGERSEGSAAKRTSHGDVDGARRKDKHTSSSVHRKAPPNSLHTQFPSRGSGSSDDATAWACTAGTVGAGRGTQKATGRASTARAASADERLRRINKAERECKRYRRDGGM